MSERRGAWRCARAELARDAGRGGAPGEDDEGDDGDANAAPGTERALRWLCLPEPQLELELETKDMAGWRAVR